MGRNELRKLPRKVAVVIENQLKAMYHHTNELKHLHCRQVLLPPKVFPVFGTHGRHHVVKVHHNMH